MCEVKAFEEDKAANASRDPEESYRKYLVKYAVSRGLTLFEAHKENIVRSVCYEYGVSGERMKELDGEFAKMKTRVVDTFCDVDIDEIKLPIIAVYRNPDDFPNNCVGRIFECEKPTNIVIVRQTVEEVRGDILDAFYDMVSLDRTDADVSSLVEVWFFRT